MVIAIPICLRLFKQKMLRAFSLAIARAGNSIAARMAMIAMTTKSSTRVKASGNQDRLRSGTHGNGKPQRERAGSKFVFISSRHSGKPQWPFPQVGVHLMGNYHVHPKT